MKGAECYPLHSWPLEGDGNKGMTQQNNVHVYKCLRAGWCVNITVCVKAVVWGFTTKEYIMQTIECGGSQSACSLGCYLPATDTKGSARKLAERDSVSFTEGGAESSLSE